MIGIYIQYSTNDGELVIAPFLPTNLRYNFQLGSAGPSTMSHDVAYSDPILTRDIVAPKRNDYMLMYSDNEGSTFTNLQGGILDDVGMDSDTWVANFAGLDWSSWLDNPYPQDRTLTLQDIREDPAVLIVMHVGLPGSAHDWLQGGDGVNQKTIISDLIDDISADGPNAIAFTVAYAGTQWTNVPGIIDGDPAGVPFNLDPYDTTAVRDLIGQISALNDPYIANFRCLPNKRLEFFFMKNKDPEASLVPFADFSLQDESQIVHIDWTNHGPAGTYVTGWANEAVVRWFTTTDVDSEGLYRRWRSNHTLGDRGQIYMSQEQIAQGTRGFADKFPQKDLKLRIKPEKLDLYDERTGFRNQIGKIVDVVYDFPDYHLIDAIFYIISQEFDTDADGNWYCDLGLQQIYTS